ncbi:DUF58 domain-containing protein [Pleionea mediterranea]|uniref:Uncharacterized protein (DUF58 family) n=1 Tax=Pleionea mediterranea TaxID=523701 RepID=A0A316FZ72_9GAMM|nr:DUF58 domain-containing protein [Pleionea mediterranea]PWK52996.1 uncharacterized protein (DUF58 family) [Pleionea mediterranea]
MRPSQTFLIGLACWFVLALIIAAYAIAESAFEYLPRLTSLGINFWLFAGASFLLIAVMDLFSLRQLSSLTSSRKVSHNLAVSAFTDVTLSIKNPLSRSVQLFVNDHYPEHSEIKGLPYQVNLKGHSHCSVTYQFARHKRGDAEFGSTRLLASSRLKLWQRLVLTAKPQAIKVYPNFAAIHQYILLSADQQTSQLGIRLAHRRGDGLEFHQLREYRLGDTLRQIDWRASSRLKKLISKEYQEEKDQNIIFLLDCGRRMRTQDQQLSHFDHSLNALLLLSYIGLKQGDAVGLLTFGGINRWLAPQKGTHIINTLLNQVYDCHPTLAASDFIEAATELNKRIRKRSLVVLISNCRDEDWVELEPAINLLNKHHLILLANLREQSLDDVLDKPVQRFEQALTYAETTEYLQQRQQLNNQTRNKGVITLDTVPKQLASLLVNQYFDIKRSGKL